MIWSLLLLIHSLLNTLESLSFVRTHTKSLSFSDFKPCKNSQVTHIVVKGNRLGGFELHKRDTMRRLATIQEIREKVRGKNWTNVSSSG